MVLAANPARSILFRIGAPLILVTMFGALLAWGYTGESAPQPTAAKLSTSLANSQPQMAPVSYKEEAPNRAPVNKAASSSIAPNGLTMEQARRIASKFGQGTVSGVQIVETDEGQAIIAINNQRKTGKSSFFVLRRWNDKFRVSARGSLDTKGFSSAAWSTELVDADEDGFQEVIFSGRDSDESRTQRRYILFVPNDNRTYSMLTNGETTPRGTPRISWLSNAAGTDAAPYRSALRQKAKQLVARAAGTRQ